MTKHTKLIHSCHIYSKNVLFLTLFHDLLFRSYVYPSVWNVITADNFTSAKRDESFSATFTKP